jgi:hypothetical protein
MKVFVNESIPGGVKGSAVYVAELCIRRVLVDIKIKKLSRCSVVRSKQFQHPFAVRNLIGTDKHL